MNIAFHNFELLLDRPLATAGDTIDAREGTIVHIEDDADADVPSPLGDDADTGSGPTVGVGEATPLYGWTESLAQCTEALSGAARLVREEGVDHALAALEDSRAARHGLSLAVHDYEARRAGVPLYRHLGGDHVESVPANATIGDGRSPITAAEAERAVEAGYDTLKVKVGNRQVHEDVARLQAVREVAPEATLRVDANGSYEDHEARRLLPELDALDVEYVEQPLGPEDLQGHVSLCEDADHGDVGIALDESLSRLPLALILEQGAADAVVLKPMTLGGPDHAREFALQARDAGVTPVISNTVESVVGRTAAVHLAASLGDVPACGLATADRVAEDLAPDPAPVEDGEMTVPQTPGIGTLGPWESD